MNRLVCDVCGANIVVQEGGQIGICDHCGASYTIERMREIVSGIKVSQTGSAEDVEQWRELVQRYMDAGSFSDAESIIKKILEAIPEDPQANEQYEELQVLKFLNVQNRVIKKYTGSAKTIIIPPSITDIDTYAFAENNFIEEVFLPNGLQIIRKGLFYKCSNLKKVHIPETVVEICEMAFFGCFSLNEVTFSNKLRQIGIGAFALCQSLTEISINGECTNIGLQAFRGCKSLSKANLSSEIACLHSGVFADCISLTEVVVSSAVKDIEGTDEYDSPYITWFKDRYGQDEVGDYMLKGSKGTFSGCESLRRVVLPENLVSIGGFSFAGCASLKDVILPQSLKEIGISCFAGCISLEEILFPRGLERIGKLAFSNCKRLRHIEIPESVQRIDLWCYGDEWFSPWYNCTQLRTILHPSAFDYRDFGGTPYGEEEKQKHMIIEKERNRKEEYQKESQRREKYRQYLNDCIRSGICPKCKSIRGEDIKINWKKRCKYCGHRWLDIDVEEEVSKTE